MRLKWALPAILLSALMWQSCGGDVATPRRRAYPRIEVADTFYTPVPGIPFNLEINDQARIERDSMRPDGSRWLNIGYPLYRGATLYVTVTPVASAARLSEVLDNRMERMALNSGGNTSEVIETTSPGGFRGKMLVTRAGTVTPLQFIAHDSAMVVTGAFFLPAANDASPDSLAPIIDAVGTDLIHIISTLKR